MEPKITVKGLKLWYGDKLALDNISMGIPEKAVTAIIGPSGCGKSTLIKCFNRMNDLVKGCKVAGEVTFDGSNIYEKGADVIDLRRRVGMVFQRATPFPFSISDNVSYGCRMAGLKDRKKLDEIVERSLRKAALYEELKDRLHESAMNLSGGQQQRMCIARTIAMEPQVILMDEPCSALDPIATQEDRGPDQGDQEGVHGGDRDAQHAAGGAGLRLYGVHADGEASGVQRDQEDIRESGRAAD